MNFKNFKKIVKKINLTQLCSLLNDLKESYKENDSICREINFMFCEVFDFRSKSKNGFLFEDNRLIFVEGHIDYLFSISQALPREEFLYVQEVRFNYYEANISQVFNGVNHFLSLLVIDDQNYFEKDIYFFKDFKNIVLKFKNDKTEFLINYLLVYFYSYKYMLLWEIRNRITHEHANPLEPVEMVFLLKYLIHFSLTLFLLFKRIVNFEASFWNKQITEKIINSTETITMWEKNFDSLLAKIIV